MTIQIDTCRSSLQLFVGQDGLLYQLHYGAAQPIAMPDETPRREDEFYPPSGNGYVFEPALQAFHADGNTSTHLTYRDHETRRLDENICGTRIFLKDEFYPFFVTLCFKAYQDEDVLEQWAEIHHHEPSAVTLFRFASSSPVFRAREYWLSQLQGDYMREATLLEECLTPGIKILDSKLGIRAHQMRNPSFLLALDAHAQEREGEVYGATLGWSGSFQFAFDLDAHNRLRALCGINPFASHRHLAPDSVFRTPSMLWSWSNEGKGRLSRNFHQWARRYGIRDADKPRPVLFNNWEATGFDFDEDRIVELYDGARDVGAETFLLDDGWFGSEHPRDNSSAGLGDWEVNSRKLPNGLSRLIDEAGQHNLKFGIWLEPEMVNPRSRLYEQRPEWVICQQNREPLLSRRQLALDLSRPEVREWVWETIENTLGPHPGIGYLKWDCNRFLTQPGSSWLRPEEQTHLTVDYHASLYDVMARFAERYPRVQAMLCAGGCGRVDYGALKFFHSFWPSDNTDPRQRVYIQWGFSHFFPACAISAHVTRMGARSVKFAVDVALSGAFGIDMDLTKATETELSFLRNAVRLYKERLRETVQAGELYRLESPYEGPRAAINYVSPDAAHGVVFLYQLQDGFAKPVVPQGLDPERKYLVREVNLHPGVSSRVALDGEMQPGAELMTYGLAQGYHKEFESTVIELVATHGG